MAQKSGTNIPFILSIKRGENVASKLADLSKGPAYGFYTGAKLPQFFQKPSQESTAAGGSRNRPTSGQSIGSSAVTATGIR